MIVRRFKNNNSRSNYACKKIDAELAALNEKHSLKYGFLIEAYEMMQEFLEYLTSKYELTRKNELKINLPEDLRTDLIHKHAKI